MTKFLKLYVSIFLFSAIRICFVLRISCFEFASKMVPRAGLEPAQSFDHEILSLARIPISPPRLLNSKNGHRVRVTKPVQVWCQG